MQQKKAPAEAGVTRPQATRCQVSSAISRSWNRQEKNLGVLISDFWFPEEWLNHHFSCRKLITLLFYSNRSVCRHCSCAVTMNSELLWFPKQCSHLAIFFYLNFDWTPGHCSFLWLQTPECPISLPSYLFQPSAF